MPLHSFIGDLQRRVLPSSRNANTDSKQHRKSGKKMEVDQQNEVVRAGKKSKMVVRLPDRTVQCGGDKENVKAAKRAFRPFDESSFKNRPQQDAKRQRTVDTGVHKLGEIQNLPGADVKVKPTNIVRPRIVKISAPAVTEDKQERSSGEKIKRVPIVHKKKATVSPTDIPIPKPKPLPKHLQGPDCMNLTELSSVISSLIDAPPDGVMDLDKNCTDTFKVPHYAREYVTYLQERERRYMVCESYLSSGDSEINTHMRAVLVDWLIQVQNHMNLVQETLHMAVALVDSFLNKHLVPLNKLQLLGITALLVASKVHERFAPQVDKLIHLTDNSYVYNEVLQMEITVLDMLDFDVMPSVPTQYLGRFLMCVPKHEKMSSLCKYMLDLSMLDTKCIFMLPSLKAAAVVVLARMIIQDYEGIQGNVLFAVDGAALTPELRFYSGYVEAQLYPCMQRLAKLLIRAPTFKLRGAVDKFSSFSQFGSISSWQPLRDSSVLQDLAMFESDTDSRV